MSMLNFREHVNDQLRSLENARRGIFNLRKKFELYKEEGGVAKLAIYPSRSSSCEIELTNETVEKFFEIIKKNNIDTIEKLKVDIDNVIKQETEDIENL